MVVQQNVVILVLTVILNCLDVPCLGDILPLSNNSLIRIRRQNNCSPPSILCSDGTCAPNFKICDGTLDCPDGADEFDGCNTRGCEEYGFQCAYSACIDGDLRCNGEQNCRDGSDEAGCGNTSVSTSTCNIENFKICDGVKDCPDGSDEVYAVCKDVPCPDYAFRCRYGACLDIDVKCNGVTECADGSDEEASMCGGGTTTSTSTPTVPISNGFCAPLNIVNGNYVVLGTGYIQGTPIPSPSIVTISCNTGFGLYPSDSVNTCIDGVWNTLPLQECRQLCPPRISTSVKVTCTIDGREVDCTKPVVDGTVAESRCDHFYTQTYDDFPTSKCSGGSWDNPLIRCDPECGQLIPSGGTNVVGGHDAIRGEFPWHIGLYRINTQTSKHDYQCGGSIITPLIVITAAHCVSSSLNARYDAQEFYVAAGKYYSNYDAAKDEPVLVQKRQVREYRIPRDYKAYYSNYAADLAVLVVVKAFTLSNVVQPVCVDWNNLYEEEQLRANSLGNVVGWGYVDPGKPEASETLKQLTAPYVDRLDCIDAVPLEFQRWVTQDKFCAGWTNGSSVCKGDSGGGLVFKRTDNNIKSKTKFYLRGLVSVGPLKERQCDNYKYGVYTKISAHIRTIKDMVASNKVT